MYMGHSTPNRQAETLDFLFLFKYVVDGHKKRPVSIFRFFLKISLAVIVEVVD